MSYCRLCKFPLNPPRDLDPLFCNICFRFMEGLQVVLGALIFRFMLNEEIGRKTADQLLWSGTKHENKPEPQG